MDTSCQTRLLNKADPAVDSSGSSTWQAKHIWAMLGVLLAWAIEQVAWVHSSSSHDACYDAFDVMGPKSLLTAVVGAAVVAAIAFGESRRPSPFLQGRAPESCLRAPDVYWTSHAS